MECRKGRPGVPVRCATYSYSSSELCVDYRVVRRVVPTKRAHGVMGVANRNGREQTRREYTCTVRSSAQPDRDEFCRCALGSRSQAGSQGSPVRQAVPSERGARAGVRRTRVGLASLWV